MERSWFYDFNKSSCFYGHTELNNKIENNIRLDWNGCGYDSLIFTIIIIRWSLTEQLKWKYYDWLVKLGKLSPRGIGFPHIRRIWPGENNSCNELFSSVKNKKGDNFPIQQGPYCAHMTVKLDVITLEMWKWKIIRFVQNSAGEGGVW